MMASGVGSIVEPDELRSLGFHAVQMFFGSGPDGDGQDPSIAEIDAFLRRTDAVLAAMTLHVDLVDAGGAVPGDIARTIRCLEKTAALKGHFGDHETPVLIWHPSAYPDGSDADDRVIFAGLCRALAAVAEAAEQEGVRVAVEITRSGSIGSAETFLRLKDAVTSDALCVCMDAANFTPDRTPLERAVRMLAPHTVIAHGKDVRFDPTGLVADYGPIGSGTLDVPAYIRALEAYAPVPYFVLEYYHDRAELLRARDIVNRSLSLTRR